MGANASNSTANVQNNSDSKCSILDGLKKFAASVPDFRRLKKGNIRHPLSDVILLLIFARTVGHLTRAAVIEFGKFALKKFQKLGILKHGIPSEPTLCRIENGIDDEKMADAMQKFADEFQDDLIKFLHDIEIISVDGKATRGTVQENGRNPDVLSAYSQQTLLVLATVLCSEKSNEIPGIPELLDKIDLKSKIFTADAIAMQKDIIDKIREKGGYFVIELKANQRSLRYGVEDKIKVTNPLYTHIVGPELGHGRIETRTYNIYDGLDLIADKKKWGGNLTIIEYVSDTIKKSTGKHTSENRLYMSNIPVNSPLFVIVVRLHWGIEVMYWKMDVVLQEDKQKRKSAKGARNLDTLLRISYNIFSIWKGKRKKIANKQKGMTELKRALSMSPTRLLNFLRQK